VDEARLVEIADGGVVPEGEGWFVLNARATRWIDGAFGAYCNFEGPGIRFSQVGINLNVLEPGQPMTMYHREDAQEDFLVVAGECLLIVEGEERPLRRWDLFHCPAGVSHAIVGAGTGPSLVVAIGARTGEEDDGTLYPVDAAAQRHGAGVAQETTSVREAYAEHTFDWVPYREGLLPD